MVGKYNIDVDNLQNTQVSVLRRVQRDAIAHIKYFYDSMSAFKYKERRVKCHDTKWFEEMLPIVSKVLKEYDGRKS